MQDDCTIYFYTSTQSFWPIIHYNPPRTLHKIVHFPHHWFWAVTAPKWLPWTLPGAHYEGVFQLMNCSRIISVATKASSPAFESFQSHGKWRSSASFSVGGRAQPVTATGSFPDLLSHVWWNVLSSFQWVPRQAAQLLNHSNPMESGGVLPVFQLTDLRSQWRPPGCSSDHSLMCFS